MSDKQPPIDVESILAATAHALRCKNKLQDIELLVNAKATLEYMHHDNWNNGTSVWYLNLEILYPVYLSVDKEHLKELEEFISEVITPFLPEEGHSIDPKIKPAEFTDTNWRQTAVVKNPSIDHYEALDSDEEILAFISYQTADKQYAGALQQTLENIGISSFLAHEDIEPSAVWRERILEELGRAKIFISLLSKNYFKSHWCVQESGIASYRKIASLHLSLDGSIPPGFSGNIQSVKVTPGNITIQDFIPGVILSNFELGIEIIIKIIGNSSSFRGAEASFNMILPHISKMSDTQIKNLLEKAHANYQIHHASRCASQYIPSLLKSHGHLLDEERKKFLLDVCSKYS